ncbi:MAG: transporter [Luteococcus sp.]|uniref:aspartate:alanine exchanger family transporter n=1 Tax=Luteococcus sp. TaxID=1969402 RepID=UPI002647B4D8|nr:TrkA C-terminal domain-containing protein [Luteococcus sp.]MDN5562864.1 transporter [Luteococcus sp.]
MSGAHLLDHLAANPLLTLMLVLSTGALLGQIKFGPLRFGAAGALFMGLVIGAFDARLGNGLGMVKSLGVVLFCYTVGLAAGSTFVSDLKRQWSLMVAGIVGLGAMAAAGRLLGDLLGLSPAHVAGAYAGVLTSPAIDAATTATHGSSDTLVGYALAYPTGVVIGMVAVALVVGRRWPGKRDNRSMAEAGIVAITCHVKRQAELREVPGFTDQSVKFSYLERDGDMRVARGLGPLLPDDRVLVIGSPDDVEHAIAFLGHASQQGDLTHLRRDVDFRRFLVSSPHLVGRSIGELNVQTDLHGVITRVRRGDLDMLARDDLVLQPGDRVLAVVPSNQIEDAVDFFGDSERHVSQVDALTMGLGISLGLLAGSVVLPLPGGIRFALGAAAGPLVVGMALGALHRTGPFRWDLPGAVNATLRQLGLMIFLAAVGLASGPAFLSQAFTLTGAKIIFVSGASLVLGTVIVLAGARLIGLSAQRATGGFAGFVGQPAILAFANAKVNDERIESAYGALFALGTIIKILLVQVIAR